VIGGEEIGIPREERRDASLRRDKKFEGDDRDTHRREEGSGELEVKLSKNLKKFRNGNTGNECASE